MQWTSEITNTHCRRYHSVLAECFPRLLYMEIFTKLIVNITNYQVTTNEKLVDPEVAHADFLREYGFASVG